MASFANTDTRLQIGRERFREMPAGSCVGGHVSLSVGGPFNACVRLRAGGMCGWRRLEFEG